MTKSNDSDSIKIVLSKKEADRLYDVLSEIRAYQGNMIDENDGITIEQSNTSGIGRNTKISWSISSKSDLTDYTVW